MKDYIIKKYKRYNEFSVFGAGDELKDYYKSLQANADRLVGVFTRLTPPYASQLKLSTANLNAIDLVSEGPIEGFVNSKGLSCNILEATYLDNTVVAEPQLSKTTANNLTTSLLKGIVYDFKPFVKERLDNYMIELQNRFIHKEEPWYQWLAQSGGYAPKNNKVLNGRYAGIIPSSIGTVTNILNCTSFGTLNGRYSGGLTNLSLLANVGAYWGKYYRSFNQNDWYLGLRYTNGTQPAADCDLSFQKCGHGYRKSPYSGRKIYHPDEVWPERTMSVPSTLAFQFDPRYPIVYKGSYSRGNGITQKGRVDRPFSARAFFSFPSSPTAYGPDPVSNSSGRSWYLWVITALRLASYKPTTWTFPNGHPVHYRNFYTESTYPEGLKEPIINNIAKKINEMGEDYWKPHKFYNSDPSIIDPPVVMADAWPNTLYNNWLQPGSSTHVALGKTQIGGLWADTFTVTTNNATAINITKQDGGDADAALNRPFDSGTRYRFTGKIYIPSNQGIDMVRLRFLDSYYGTNNQTADNKWVDISGGTAECPFNQWNNFDITLRTWPDRKSRFMIQGYSGTTNNPANANGAYWALNNLTALEETKGVEDAIPNTGSFAYMTFDAQDFFGTTNFKKNYELTYSVGGGRLELNDPNGLQYSYPEVTGFDLSQKSFKESIIWKNPIAATTCDKRNRTPYQYPTITGATPAVNYGISLEESESNKFKGAFLYPVYLGEDFVPLQINGEVNTGKILISTSDSAAISGAKVASGVSNNYDVFSLVGQNISYVHVANPNIKVPDVEVLNKPISLRLVEKEPTLFNFTNFDAEFNLGEEDQPPLNKESISSIDYNKALYGPNNPNQPFDDTIYTGASDSSDSPILIKGGASYSALAGNSSVDVQSDGTQDFQSDWMANLPLDRDGIDITHRVERKDVDSVIITFVIEQLYQEILSEQDLLGVSVKSNPLAINFSVFCGFDGVPEYEEEETKISYFGMVSSFYAVDTEQIVLPSYDEIKSIFPNEDTRSLSARFPRTVRIVKNDYETSSTRMGRSARLFQVKEIIKEAFSYPFSAVIKTKIDARTFTDPPNKQFNLRLKKVKIPSNYFPLDLRGKDKRFVENAEDLGTRVIYDGDWDGTFKIGWTDNPAWILYDLLTSQRYGIGNTIDNLEDINIFNLYKIGRYCDAVDGNGNFVGLSNGLLGLEPRYSCNIMLDVSANAFDSIKDISSVFNGMAFWANGALDFFTDQPKEPMMFFSNGNVFDGMFNYQSTNKSSLFNVADVAYADKRDNFAVKTESVIDEEGMRKNGLQRRVVTAKGATSRSQARRLGKYILYSNKLEREIVNFKTSAEALMVSIGDIIEIQDELKNFNISYAKAIEIGTNYITLENGPSASSILNNNSGISVIVPTGQDTLNELHDYTLSGGLIGEQELHEFYTPQVKKLKITGVLDLDDKIKIQIEDPSGYLPYVQTGSFVNLDLENRNIKQYRVLTLTPEQDNLYSISATEHNKEKFNLIEAEDNFTLDEVEPFNIGILDNEIKTLTEPEGFSTSIINTTYNTQKINFTVSGNLTGNENAYEVTLIHPNGKIDNKKIAKQANVEAGYFKTTGTFHDVITYGNHIFKAKSINRHD